LLDDSRIYNRRHPFSVALPQTIDPYRECHAG
jgi:hypothetical protein